jgi:hypothetical protein
MLAAYRHILIMHYSRNESVVVNLKNMWEGMDTQEIAKRIVGKRLYVGE